MFNPCLNCKEPLCSAADCPAANAAEIAELDAHIDDETEITLKEKVSLPDRLKSVLGLAGIKTPKNPRAQIVIQRGSNFLAISATDQENKKIKSYSGGLKGRICLHYRKGVLMKIMYYKK